MGGLSRFSTLLQDTKPVAKNRILIQTGNFGSKKSSLTGDELQQARLKTQLQMDVLTYWNVAAIGLGTRDLSLGLEWWGNYLQRKPIPLVSTNLQCSSYFQIPTYIVEPNSQIAILSLVPENFTEQGCETKSIENSIQTALLDAQARHSNIKRWIVMGEITTTEQLQIGQKFPELDLYFDAKSPTPVSKVQMQIEDWAAFSVGTRGKNVGVVYWDFDENSLLRILGQDEQAQKDLLHNQNNLTTAQKTLEDLQSQDVQDAGKISRAKNRVVFYETRIAEIEKELSKEIPEKGDSIHFEMIPLSRELSDFEPIQKMVEATKTSLSLVSLEEPPNYDGIYVGSSSCQSCHTKQYSAWSKTPHAHAYQTLKNENRQLDFDCYSCHVTGAFDVQGPIHPKQFVGILENVGCESCHGAARQHIANGERTSFSKPTKEVCTKCHDGIRDEGRFDLETYMERVRHVCIGN